MTKNIFSQVQRWRRQGKTIVFTNGCFDLLHMGHLRLLEKAKALGDVLVVGINNDRSVRRIKGNGRPIVPAQQRAALVNALKPVDAVVIFAEDTPEKILAKIKPDIHVKGGDWDPKALPEKTTVEAYGGRIRIIPYINGFSTTDIVVKIKKTKTRNYLLGGLLGWR